METVPAATIGPIDGRPRWMSALAKAQLADLEAAFARLDPPPSYRRLRGPEIGMVMVRGRAGGTGTRFNLGEMTATRCTVQLADGGVGHGYVGGRDKRHAELAALFDALLQDASRRPALLASLVDPLVAAQEGRREARARKAAATKVEFFTMVRGE